MENRVKSQITALPGSEQETDSLQQILNVATPAIVRTLVFNLQRIKRANFNEERATQSIVYRKFSTELDVTSRDIVLEAVAQSIRGMNLNTEALITFIENDSSPMIVSKAIKYYLECSPSPLDNPLRSVSDLIELVQDKKTKNKGVILAGLVSFGDRRICAALRPHQDNLSLDTLRQFAVSIRDDRLHKASMDYCLSWLVSLLKQAKNSPKVHEQASLVASAITRLILHASGQVEDRQFHFGCHGFRTYSDSNLTTYADLVESFEPLLETILTFNNQAAATMVELFREPGPKFAEESDRRQTEQPRRKSLERRAEDRRIVSITTKIERRRENRRLLQRRHAERR